MTPASRAREVEKGKAMKLPALYVIVHKGQPILMYTGKSMATMHVNPDETIVKYVPASRLQASEKRAEAAIGERDALVEQLRGVSDALSKQVARARQLEARFADEVREAVGNDT